MFKNINMQQVYQQDYSCILDPVEGKGALYIGNLEAAENPNTLHSNPRDSQNTPSKPFWPPAEASPSNTPDNRSLTTFKLTPMITNPMI